MIVRGAGAGEFIRVNAAFQAEVGFSPEELADKPFADWIDPEDHERLRLGLEQGAGGFRVHHRTRSGDLLGLEVDIADKGQGPVVLGHCALPSAKEADGDEEDEATVSGTLATIARIVEEQNPGYKCSILLVEDGRFVRGAGPSLPEEYNAAIDGFAVGPTVGSCGTAIFWNVRVVVEDIQADPLWSPFAELAKKAGVAACWSHPFTSKSGAVLGALALYAPEPRAPTPEQLSRLRAAARMTGLAVERGRAEEALRKQRLRELELEAQLRQAAKMEALGVLAGGVAHDFNNVLGTILANAEFALELLSPEEPAREMLREIAAASKRAGGFCEQMLAYAGRGAIASSRFELAALVRELSGLVQAAVPKKATLEYSLAEEPIFVHGDPNQLLQVIMNLVANAADALGDDGGRIVVGSSVEHYDAAALSDLAPKAELSEGQYVRLTVSDDGCGMDEETVARIFDPFFTTKATGHGLGLAAAQGIVLNHGGVILLESELEKGTTFTILLPTAAAAERVESAPTTPPSSTDPRQHILVVDDEDGLRDILAKRLRHSGYKVSEAADGEQAVQMFLEAPESIDCVLLDLSMPKLGGEEVYQEVRAVRASLPIVLMSGYAEQELIAKFPSDGLAAALQKPIQAADLMGAIRSALSPADVPRVESAVAS